jgi:hypothetical protein
LKGLHALLPDDHRLSDDAQVHVGGWADWSVLSMLLIGLALILGVGVRLASIGGIVRW